MSAEMLDLASSYATTVRSERPRPDLARPGLAGELVDDGIGDVARRPVLLDVDT